MIDDPSTPEVPEELARALRRVHPRPAPPAPERERALLAQARERLAAPPLTQTARASPLRRLVPLGLGALAAALALWLALGTRRGELDLDGSGGVDVLDAFALARGLRAAAPPRRFDVDGDGQVDQRDVDHLLAAVVRVEP